MNRSELESILVGVQLPASKQQLLDYARAQPGGAEAAALLQRLPDDEYRNLPDVGEALEPRQPHVVPSVPDVPSSDSDLAPGGPAYVGDPVEPANVDAVRGGG